MRWLGNQLQHPVVQNAFFSQPGTLQVLAKEPEERRSSELGPILRVWIEYMKFVSGQTLRKTLS